VSAAERLFEEDAGVKTKTLASMIVLASSLSAHAAKPAATTDQTAADPHAVAKAIAENYEKNWPKLAANPPEIKVGSRDLLVYGLTLCEAGVHMDRLERLLELATSMQDRDPESRTYGNFAWTWGQDKVLDGNAVDFCMQAAVRIWRDHRAKLSSEAYGKLSKLIELGIEGSLRHHVRTNYTNIALLNASNLVLLGEVMNRPDVAAEGRLRLQAVLLYTWSYGTHEYDSPTYYRVDFDALAHIEHMAIDEQVRREAAALLRLMWMDIAASGFAPSGRLAGAHSRSYDYLHGVGEIPGYLQRLPGFKPVAAEHLEDVFQHLSVSNPPEEAAASSRHFPRYVRQSCGAGFNDARTHSVHEDVTLSTASAHYGPMDMPLTVDLPGPLTRVRGYFIPDGREDPYGKTKIPVGNGVHSKTHHLEPMWIAAQDYDEAVAIALYRDEETLLRSHALQSHFVFPADVDEVYIAGKLAHIGKKGEYEVPAGAPVVLRFGTAAVGLRVPWARTTAGRPAPTMIVNDGNKFGALRLTVQHGNPSAGIGGAGVALAVRIGSRLDAKDFTAWRKKFEADAVQVSSDDQKLSVASGMVKVEANPAKLTPLNVVPVPCQTALEIDGREVGRPILESAPVVKAFVTKQASAKPIEVTADKGVYFEAEDGLVLPPMLEAESGEASGGRYIVASSGVASDEDFGGGQWLLKVGQKGRYFIWGRVLSPTSESDSFRFRIGGQRDGGAVQTWSLGTHKAWTWVALHADKAAPGFDLEAGEQVLHLSVREAGAKIDRWYISANAAEKPR
jgi:hypothetical protein